MIRPIRPAPVPSPSRGSDTAVGISAIAYEFARRSVALPELALAGALTGITGNAGIATSVAVLFRVATYWLRIPIGWVAMRYLQKTGEL